MSQALSDCFIEEPVTRRILENVTRYCSGCYAELEEGRKIYYDTGEYRYLCRRCAEEKAQRLDERCADDEEEGEALF